MYEITYSNLLNPIIIISYLKTATKRCSQSTRACKNIGHILDKYKFAFSTVEDNLCNFVINKLFKNFFILFKVLLIKKTLCCVRLKPPAMIR